MNILASLIRWHRRVQGIRDLHNLPPHLLRDIGIERGQIDDAVSGLLSRGETAEPAPPEPRKIAASAQPAPFGPIAAAGAACR